MTGGAGFIGSHVVEQLLQAGHKVVVLDNLSTGRLANLSSFALDPKFTFHAVDIADLAVIRPHFEGIDWVFHLAALADIVPSIEQPIDYTRANVTGTIHVCEAARQARCKRFVYAASSSCYGIPDALPTPETAAARPQYPYALSKYLGEQVVLHWGQVYKLPVVALRLFNVYGPRSRTSGSYGAVFGVFLAQKLAAKPYTVVGDGTQTRDFTFVADVARAFVMAAASSVSQEAINIGSGQPQSVNRLVELLGGEVVHVPKRPGEPDCTQADNRKADRLLGWQPWVSFEKGVRILLDHIDYWRQAPVWDARSIDKATKAWFRYLGTNAEKAA